MLEQALTDTRDTRTTTQNAIQTSPRRPTAKHPAQPNRRLNHGSPSRYAHEIPSPAVLPRRVVKLLPKAAGRLPRPNQRTPSSRCNRHRSHFRQQRRHSANGGRSRAELPSRPQRYRIRHHTNRCLVVKPRQPRATHPTVRVDHRQRRYRPRFNVRIRTSRTHVR